MRPDTTFFILMFYFYPMMILIIGMILRHISETINLKEEDRIELKPIDAVIVFVPAVNFVCALLMMAFIVESIFKDIIKVFGPRKKPIQ